MTKFEEQVYNTHLAVSRSIKGEPYKFRKDFTKLEEDKIVLLKRLESFFSNYPNVDLKDFFMAPYKVYPDGDYYGLDYYITRNALKSYTQYMKQLEVQDPDSMESLIRLQKGLQFVIEFCKEHNITLGEYEKFQPNSILSFLDHLKNHKINFYVLHALTFGFPVVDSKILEFMFEDFYGTFRMTRNKYYASKKMKDFGKQAKDKIENKLYERKE